MNSSLTRDVREEKGRNRRNGCGRSHHRLWCCDAPQQGGVSSTTKPLLPQWEAGGPQRQQGRDDTNEEADSTSHVPSARDGTASTFDPTRGGFDTSFDTAVPRPSSPLTASVDAPPPRPRRFIPFGPPVGRGRSSRVYRVIDAETLDATTYVAKVVCAEKYGAEAEAELRMRRLQQQQQLHLSGAEGTGGRIVRYHAAYVDPIRSTMTFVMERSEHGSLQDVLDSYCGSQRQHPDKVSLALPFLNFIRSVARDLFKGLAHLHSTLGVAHLDVKPSNVLITNELRAVIADFGSSRVLPPQRHHQPDRPEETDTRPEKSSREESSVVESSASSSPFTGGTLLYASPERLLGTSVCHAKSDVWSTGMTILVACLGGCGKHPYKDARTYWEALDGAEGISEEVERSDIPRPMKNLLLLCFADEDVRPLPSDLLRHDALREEPTDEKGRMAGRSRTAEMMLSALLTAPLKAAGGREAGIPSEVFDSVVDGIYAYREDRNDPSTTTSELLRAGGQTTL